MQIIRNIESLNKTLDKKLITLKISPIMAQYILNNKYNFFKEKNTNNNIIKIDIDNTLMANKFIISAEKKFDTNEVIDETYKEAKGSNKKGVKKKVLNNKTKKKVIENKNNHKPLKKQLIKKEKNSKKKSELVKTKPIKRKIKKVKKSESLSANDIQKSTELKQVKTGWWDI